MGQDHPAGVAWLGYFYGGNIGGAVIGSLLAGFYLLRVFDMAIASYVAVALNITVALIGLLLSKTTPNAIADVDAGEVRRAPGARAVYIAIALSGFTALAAQVLWTRLLSLTFGATAYTFSLILAASCSAWESGAAWAPESPRVLKTHERRSAGCRCCCVCRSRGRPTC
jgi:spermidine synthase